MLDVSVRAGVLSLLDQLRRSTTQIDAPFVVSAFDGNAGIVQFTDARTYALKCETHNHPSAIEPFGGANTGVGGVIRDIIGAAQGRSTERSSAGICPADWSAMTAVSVAVSHQAAIRTVVDGRWGGRRATAAPPATQTRVIAGRIPLSMAYSGPYRSAVEQNKVWVRI